LIASPRSSTERPHGWARLGLLALVMLSTWTAPKAVSAASATSATSAEYSGRARAVLADSRYQRELPNGDSSAPRSRTPAQLPEEPGDRSPLPNVEPDVDPGVASLPLTGISTLAHVVLWILLSAAVVLALLWGLRSLPERRRAAEPPPAERAKRETPGPGTLGDPAGLAAQGRYTEAVHALLLAAIALLSRRFRLPLPPSRTSRELLRALPLQGPAREAFAGLVGTVERSWFGGAAIGPEEYAASVERFKAVEGREG
jgi:hypothetical protein